MTSTSLGGTTLDRQSDGKKAYRIDATWATGERGGGGRKAISSTIPYFVRQREKRIKEKKHKQRQRKRILQTGYNHIVCWYHSVKGRRKRGKNGRLSTTSRFNHEKWLTPATNSQAPKSPANGMFWRLGATCIMIQSGCCCFVERSAEGI